MKVELKKISFNERMSEETNCFVADLYINDKKVGYVKNDGRGGCTDYHGNTKEDNQIIAQAEAHFKTLPKIRSEEFNFEYQPNLESAIDEEFEKYLKAKAQKKMEKQMEYAILFGIPNGNQYHMIKYKIPLSVLVKTHKAQLQKKVLEIQLNECNGSVVILNTNLAELGISILI